MRDIKNSFAWEDSVFTWSDFVLCPRDRSRRQGDLSWIQSLQGYRPDCYRIKYSIRLVVTHLIVWPYCTPDMISLETERLLRYYLGKANGKDNPSEQDFHNQPKLLQNIQKN